MTEDPIEKGGINRTAKTPRLSETLLAVVVVACSFGAFAYRDVVASRSASDGVDRLLTLYASVAGELPAGARIGFLSLVADSAASGAAKYTAQNALAPRLLDTDLTTVSFVITTPNAPQALDHDPRLTDFELLGTSAGGIRIYGRRQ